MDDCENMLSNCHLVCSKSAELFVSEAYNSTKKRSMIESRKLLNEYLTTIYNITYSARKFSLKEAEKILIEGMGNNITCFMFF